MASLKKKISEQNASEEGDSGTRGRSPAWWEMGASAPGEPGNGETVTSLACLEARTWSPRGLRKSSFIIWFEESKHLRCAGNDLFTGALTGLEASLWLMDGTRP